MIEKLLENMSVEICGVDDIITKLEKIKEDTIGIHNNLQEGMLSTEYDIQKFIIEMNMVKRKILNLLALYEGNEKALIALFSKFKNAD